jgi:hypothetical protein
MRPIAIAALTVLLAAAPAHAAEDMAKLKGDAANLIKTYAGTLQTALQTAMKDGGPVKAIEVCKEIAPHVAADLSKDGWTIGRTSQRVRNPNALPDAYEQAALANFLVRLEAGEKPDTLVKAEVVSENGGKTFRLVKAIPVAEVCLTCHGTDIKPPVQDALNKLYPSDIATGFKPGDIRGIFTVKKAL